MPNPPPPTLDPAALAKLTEIGGNEFLLQMLNIFLDYAPTKVAEINAALLTRNLETIRTAAHPLKSSASNIGANELRRLAIETETAAADGHHEKIPPLAAALTNELARVTDALQNLRRQLTA